MSMFPSVASKDPSLLEKLKDKKNHDIPKDNPSSNLASQKDRNSKSYKKLLGSPARTPNFENKISQKKTYFQKRMNLMDRIKKAHPNYHSSLQEFQDFLTGSKLPNFFIYYSLLPLLKEVDVNGFIMKMKKVIKEENSAYHRITTAIKARQECLLNLKTVIGQLKKDFISEAGTREKLKEAIKHYRALTANTIDEIKRWRDGLGSTQQKAVFYTQDNQNYLIKLLNDNHFIFNSELASNISFAEKNDPFIIVPLKRAQESESNQHLDLIQTQKNIAFYQKYMDYLASEKAYQLSLIVESPIKKRPKMEVEKVYKSKSTFKLKQAEKPIQHEQINYEALEKQKQREERLRKNQERINSIKSIYQARYNKHLLKQLKKEKKVQTDVESNVHNDRDYSSTKKKTTALPRNAQSQFQKIVRLKYQRQKTKNLLSKPPQLVLTQPKSLSKPKKQNKKEDKIMDNLKQIQSSLKNKLSFMHQTSKNQESSLRKMALSGQQFGKKSNEALISELKSEIIRNLQLQSKERQAQRQKRRQEQEKAIEEIKAKMKKEMQEKLQRKKKEKLMEREQLEKKLKEEQERLGKQRQIQLQLQLKLAKEKQLRELEKLKRQALEKEKKFREELEKEQQLRRERQEAIEAERREKQKLLQELKKKELKEQLQEEIKQELREKYGSENPKLYDRQEIAQVKARKQQELTKEIQLLKLKENQEIEQIRRENELRERMLKLKKDEEELKRKEVENLMKHVIQEEKEAVQRETLQKRLQLEEELKNNAKEKLLQEYRAQKQAALENVKAERERQLEEEAYRQKIKDKIEREMRIEAINKTKKEMEQRENRRYQINMQMELSKKDLKKALDQDIDRERIQSEVKKQLVEKVIFDKQAEKEAAKNDLRAQFEKQLLAMSGNQLYEAKDSVLKKNIEKYKQDDYLTHKLAQLQGAKPITQKDIAVSNEDSRMVRNSSNSFPKKMSMSVRNNSLHEPTHEQLQIYSKKKNRMSEMREEPSHKLPTKLPSQEQEGFELVRVVQQNSQEKNSKTKSIRKESTNTKMERIIQESEQNVKKSKKKRKQSSADSQDSEIKRKIKKSKGKIKRKYESEEESYESSAGESGYNKKKKNNKRIQKRQSDEALSSQYIRDTNQSKLRQTTEKIAGSGKVQSNPNKTKFSRNISIKKQQDQIQNSAVKIHFDAEKSKLTNSMEESKGAQKQSKITIQSKYQIRLEAIPEDELDEYLAGHFEQLPQVQRGIQLFDRQELYRKLINQLTFCMLLGYEKDILVGAAFAFHDRNKIDARKFQFIHFSTYKNEDLKDFLMSSVNYIFKKDPADEIEFHLRFNEDYSDQLAFSTDFNKWFDKYGSVYQKKVMENTFQRKYLLKRQFYQKCEVVLGGVNKNTFRNLFSVYCGVLMSDLDMIQFKEELKDVVTPQNQISYSIAIAEMFRTYLTPDEADVLKSKVKEFAKLKELLVLVVMLQKKKVKMEELKLSQYKSLIELNMKLMSQGKDVIRYCKDGGVDLNRLYYAQLSQAYNLPFNFQTTSLPIQSQQDQKVHQISYFRLSPLPPNKLHIIKSSLYNTELHILPTQSTKYKLFVINAQQYNEIKQTNHLDIFMYVRLFLKNVKSHSTASWKYVWLPEMSDKASYQVREFKSFLNKDIYCHDSINISYKQFLPNALIIQPQHRDLVITPPFIVGIMSMSLEQVTEGSPLYARMIDVPALRTLEIQEN